MSDATTKAGAPPRPMSDAVKERTAQRLAATRNEKATRLALAIGGLIAGEDVLCPECRKPAPRGKFKIHPDGGWKHFSRTGCSGDAVSILKAVGIGFGDALRVLNGLPTRTEIKIPEGAEQLAAGFVGQRSKVNLEVFNGVLWYGRKTGGVQAAQDFYGTWHIDPGAVESAGAVYITDPKHFAKAIVDRFGLDALLESGLFVNTKHGPYCLISEKFPVVEPHRHPATGDVLYMQLRGSHAQQARHLAHKADPDHVPYKGNEKFISLRGAPRSAQIGCGLHLIEPLEPGSTIYIVEGFKDHLAGMTLGLHTYGIPGVDFRPPEKVCRLLARHTVKVALDGDDAGVGGRDGVERRDSDGNVVGWREGLIDYLRRHGVNASAQSIGPPAAQLDVTDFLVAAHASGKMTGTPCPCATCTQTRERYPDRFRR